RQSAQNSEHGESTGHQVGSVGAAGRAGRVRGREGGTMDTREPMTSGELPFGQQLRRYRRAAGLTQKALARHAHLSMNAIAALESGRRRWPHEETIALLATALQLSPEQHAQLAHLAAAGRPHAPLPFPAAAPSPCPPAALGTALVAVPLTPLLGREREE